MAEVAIMATSVAKAGNEARLKDAPLAPIEPTRREPGALQYELRHDLAEPRRFMFIERRKNGEAFAAHAESAHIAAWRAH